MDYWAHRHADDPQLRKEAHDPGFEQAVAEMGGDEPDLPDMPPDLDDFETISDDVLG